MIDVIKMRVVLADGTTINLYKKCLTPSDDSKNSNNDMINVDKSVSFTEEV